MLTKGFEVELYTGTPLGDVIGLSNQITQDLPGFMREPDNRNVEYVTPPLHDYDRLLCELLMPRFTLRQYLSQQNHYTLLPGSTLSLGDTKQFYRSDPGNPYHTYIEQTYGTNVVTASVHINIGIAEIETLLRACRVLRMEAPLFLALSAASPFLDGEVTGYHSTRWGVFPKTPAQVPLFTNHLDFIQWTEAQIATGKMQNVRHLWSSVRPNGPARPFQLDRVELRICDLVSNPIKLLAITALLEARLLQLMADPTLDPLQSSEFRHKPVQLEQIADDNEAATARYSLDAKLTHWQDGRSITAKDWIEELYAEIWPTAKAQGFSCFLAPIRQILQDGNEAQQWLKLHAKGWSVRSVLQQAILAMELDELELRNKLCQPVGV